MDNTKNDKLEKAANEVRVISVAIGDDGGLMVDLRDVRRIASEIGLTVQELLDAVFIKSRR